MKRLQKTEYLYIGLVAVILLGIVLAVCLHSCNKEDASTANTTTNTTGASTSTQETSVPTTASTASTTAPTSEPTTASTGATSVAPTASTPATAPTSVTPTTAPTGATSVTSTTAAPTTAPTVAPTTAPTTEPTTAPTAPPHDVHTLGNWSTKVYATCLKEGTQIRKCTGCDYTESRSVAKTSHKFDARNICKTCYYVEFDENTPLVELGVICNNWYSSSHHKARWPWDIKVWNGKVYRGAGDYDTNSGDTTILAYDIATHTWDTSSKVQDEAIHGFVEINGTLFAPGIDARESKSYGNYYFLDENGKWQKVRNLPNGIHNFDMIECNGRIFAALGTATVGNTVVVSEDGGKTFKFAPLYKDGKPYSLSGFSYSRTYEFVKLNGTVHALIALYNKNDTPQWGIYRYEDGKMHYVTEGTELLDGSEFSRKYFGGDFELNGTCYLTARRLYAIKDFSDPSSWQTIGMPNSGKVSDAILKDGTIYVLSSRQDMKTKIYHVVIYSSTTGEPGSFQEVTSFDYSGFPLSFDYDGECFYVGTSLNPDPAKVGMVLRVKPQ